MNKPTQTDTAFATINHSIVIYIGIASKYFFPGRKKTNRIALAIFSVFLPTLKAAFYVRVTRGKVQT